MRSVFIQLCCNNIIVGLGGSFNLNQCNRCKVLCSLPPKPTTCFYVSYPINSKSYDDLWVHLLLNIPELTWQYLLFYFLLILYPILAGIAEFPNSFEYAE